MTNFSFSSKENKELTTSKDWVIGVYDLGGEFSDLTDIAEDNAILTVLDSNTIQLTIPKSISPKFPSPKKIMLMIFIAIRSIVCPSCGGVPKA